MRISAAVLRRKGGSFLHEQLVLEPPRNDEVLVRIAGVGLCHTDLSFRDSLICPTPFPIVLGHEGSGIVEAVGENVTKVLPGDHVVLTYASCQNCVNCKAEQTHFCHHFFEENFSGRRKDASLTLHKGDEDIHGCFHGQSSFADYALANESSVVKVSKSAPLELLGPLGCGFQTGAGAIMNTFAPEKGSSIAIFGCGSVGMAAILAAKAVGCREIIAIDINGDRLEIAQSLGATHAINPETLTTNVVEKIREITKVGADYALECIGIPKVLRQAFDCLAVPGVCGAVGASPAGTEVTLDMSQVFGKSIVGIIQCDGNPETFIPQLVSLYEKGLFPIDKLVKKYALSEINQAVEDTETGKVIKAVLIP